jgi:DNA invertase Pin-like site-specific DNA recombinase
MIARNRVAIYVRVSTVDKGQDPETQLLALREYAARRGFLGVGEYVEYASGTREGRPRYRALLEVARKRQVDAVLVWRHDRFARSAQALVRALKEFHSLGEDFISYQENIDTTPQGEMIFTVMASLAQFESALISEQVKAGKARAKAQGKRISRAPTPAGVQARIGELYTRGLSIHQMSQQLEIGYGTAWNYVQRVKQGLGRSGVGNPSSEPLTFVHLLPKVQRADHHKGHRTRCVGRCRGSLWGTPLAPRPPWLSEQAVGLRA